MTDALQEAIRYYFTHTNIIRIFSCVFEYNLPSIKVLEKTGFTEVGIMKNPSSKMDTLLTQNCLN